MAELAWFKRPGGSSRVSLAGASLASVLALTAVTLGCGRAASNASNADVLDTASASSAFVPTLIASFGDSKDTGAFSNSTAGERPTKEAMEVFRKLPLPWFLGNVLNLPIGLKMQQKIVPRPEVNAFTGSVDWSHRSRLSAKFGRPIEGKQFAIVGGSMDSIDWQFKDAEAHYKRIGRSADYVVFDFGAVDFIVSDDTPKFESRYNAALVRLLQLHPNARILLLQIPDIVGLLTAKEQPLAFTLPIVGAVTCDKMRGALKLGDELGLTPEATAEAIALQQQRRATLNRVIANAAVQAPAKVPGFSGRISIAPEVSYVRPDIGALMSLDCMHPSERGLRSIADETWTAARGLLQIPNE